MNFLKPYVKPYTKDIIIASTNKAISTIIDIVLPLLLTTIVAIGVETNDISEVYRYGILMVVLSVISTTTCIIAHRTSAHLSEKLGYDLRKSLYMHKQKLSISDLKHYSYAALTTRIVYDVENVAKFVSICTRMVVRCVIMGVSGIVLASIINFQITMVLIVSMAIVFIISRLMFHLTNKWYLRVSEGIDTSSATIREAITGIKTIKSFAKQHKEEAQFATKNQDIYDAQLHAGITTSFFSPMITLTSNVTLGIILLVSGINVQNGLIDVLRLTSLIVYLNMFMQAMVSFSRILVRFSRASASAGRIYEILNIKPYEKYIKPQDLSTENAIEMNNVNFKFGKRKILNDINISIKKGSLIGIVGETGSGKTTFVELLTGIYQNYKGQIIVNGCDIEYTPNIDIAKNIGIARQKFDIFTDTIQNNIILDKEFNQEKFDEAAKLAQIYDFIKENSKDQDVRQSGTNLSGGQRQRINLARLFYNDPEILVLDDVSSALDAKTNAKLNDSLSTLYGKKTIIYISNKIKSLEKCDKIIVLENGEVTGFASHNELVKTNACYQKLLYEQPTEESIYEED